MRITTQRLPTCKPTNPDQEILNFSPIEWTPEQRERLERETRRWLIEEEMEQFHQLPGVTMADYNAAREAYRQDLELFGPLFKPRTSEAWQILHGQYRPPPPPWSEQLTLPFPKEFEDDES